MTLETAAVLPLVALVLAGVVQMLGVARDVLVAQEAARAGARAAAAAGRAAPAVRAAQEAAGPVAVDVTVTPAAARPGRLVTVRTTVTVRLGPVRRPVVARAAAMVEPGAGRADPGG